MRTNVLTLVSAMRRADATYAFMSYHRYKNTSVTGDLAMRWQNNSSLLVTSIDDAIEPVTLYWQRYGASSSNIEGDAYLRSASFSQAVFGLFKQVSWQLSSGTFLDNDAGGGTFHINVRGLAFMDYDPFTTGHDLTRVWSLQV